MRDWLSWILKLLIPFIIAAIIINDAGVIIISRSQSKDIAKTIADDARSAYISSNNEYSAYKTALNTAQTYNVKLYGFKLTKEKIQIWIQIPPRKTIFIHRMKNLKKMLTFNYYYDFSL